MPTKPSKYLFYHDFDCVEVVSEQVIKPDDTQNFLQKLTTSAVCVVFLASFAV